VSERAEGAPSNTMRGNSEPGAQAGNVFPIKSVAGFVAS
jgi:hypothetical protein